MPVNGEIGVKVLKVGRSKGTHKCTKCDGMAEEPLYAIVKYLLDGEEFGKGKWYFCTTCKEEVDEIAQDKGATENVQEPPPNLSRNA